MATLFDFLIGDTKPDITGTFAGVDLTGATVTCVLENLADGTAGFGNQAASIVSASATKTTVKYTVPSAFAAAAEYVGWFVAVLSSQTYRTPGFVVRVSASDRTPLAYPFIYGDGRGGYANVSDVMALLYNRDAFSKNTDEKRIEALLGDTAVELDQSLAAMYVTPIARTQPKAWAYLRVIHKYWAVAALYDVLAPQNPDAHIASAALFREKGAMLLDALLSGDDILEDATARDGKPVRFEGVAATIAAGLDEEADANNTPIFSVNSFRRNWRLE